ncbi:hypothetical protein [Chitinophaga arvensicola]|uniref:Uncharacterized protein n=1 Tax=Chitinophaga arvensicola TaxID=29529 RepID=A0A1I0SE62_9BACT|nr:hypothetical protein [Chitinophaga arvensicola]SEW57266.1 hypothetical protein SAMN04488122_6718 [Chitinophaga arvensicola]
MIVLVIILALLLLLAWVVLLRQFRVLMTANIRLIKEEQQAAAVLFQLKEAKEKQSKLEEKLRKMQYELYQERQQKENHH